MRATALAVLFFAGTGCRERPLALAAWPAWLEPCEVAGLLPPVHCGFVQVPEASDAPSGRRLSLRVVVVASGRPAPQPDPIVVLAGGPGQAATDLAAGFVRRTVALREAHDFVFVEQRGTGGTHALACPPADRGRDLFGRLFDPARLTACRDVLAARADLTRYTTTAAAADASSVLEALGYRRAHLWAGSYGTRLALEIARRDPARVRTILLDGAVPTSFAWPTTGAETADAALDAVVADCAKDAACARDFPTFGRDVDAAFAALGRATAKAAIVDPRTNERDTIMFSRSDLSYSTRGLLYGTGILSLPLFFKQAAAGQFDAFAQAYVERARALEPGIAMGVHLSVYCAEDLPFVDQDRARQAALPTRMGTYLLDEYQRACEVWPQGRIPADFRDPVRAAVPTFIFAGRRDPVTPPSTAETVAQALTNVRVVVWPFGGHNYDGTADGTCRARLLQAFFGTGTFESLPADCAADAPRVPFRRPF